MWRIENTGHLKRIDANLHMKTLILISPNSEQRMKWGGGVRMGAKYTL